MVFCRGGILIVVLMVHLLANAQTDTARSAQTAFRIKTGTDIAMIGMIMASSFTYLYWSENDFHTFRQAAALSVDDLPAVDQPYINIDREKAGWAITASDYLAYGSAALPLAALLTGDQQFSSLLTCGFIYAEGLALTAAVTANLKTLTDRPRPMAYSDSFTRTERTNDDAWRSMPSGHTATTAYNTFFAAAMADRLIWRKDQTAWRIGTWTLAAGIPAVTGYLRMQAGKHFPTDVMAGYALGAGMGLLIPFLHRNEYALQVQPVSTSNCTGLHLQIQF